MNLGRTRVRRHVSKVVVVGAVALLSMTLAGSGSGATAADDVLGGAKTTWVSGVGDDVNPCSRTAPCKTFYGAFDKTSQPDGVMNALDPGNFAYVGVMLTIDRGMVINGGPGTVFSPFAVTDGIVVSAPATEVVVLRNLRLNGNGAALHGINFVSGKALYIEDSVIEGFTGDGIHVSPTAGGHVVLDNVTVRDNGANGVNAEGGGASALARVTVSYSHIEDNAAAGVLAADHSDVTVDNSTVTGNLHGLACVVQLAGACAITATTNVIDHNEIGVLSGRGVPTSTGRSRLYIGGNSIVGNGTGLSLTTSPTNSQIISFADNTVAGNVVRGSPTSTAAKL